MIVTDVQITATNDPHVVCFASFVVGDSEGDAIKLRGVAVKSKEGNLYFNYPYDNKSRSMWNPLTRALYDKMLSAVAERITGLKNLTVEGGDFNGEEQG